MRLFSIARTRKLPLNLIVAEEGGAAVYVLQDAKDGHPVPVSREARMGLPELIRSIASSLHVSTDSAHALYEQYRTRTMSASAARAFKKILDPALTHFFEALEKKNIRGFVYVDAATNCHSTCLIE